LKFREFAVVSPATASTLLQNAAQFRAAFLFCRPVVWRATEIGDLGRPYHLEPLEHGFNLIMHLKPLLGSSPLEKPAMGGQPPVAGTLVLTFIPGKLAVD
jgi:hypothetical protein